MQVDVENGLSAVRVGVHNETITALVNTFLFCEFPCGCDEMSHQWFVGSFQIIDRIDVNVRHDQDVRRRDRIDIAEGGHLFVAVS